ncbi:hypothetical protein PTKIN_Ptkin06aG0082100 [Pterospermum kingtungense]
MASSSPSSPLSIGKDSLTISKEKPKIRIIHIFAPEIIKTDVANFRELVQRLTGKPSQDHKGRCKKKPRIVRSNDTQEPRITGFCENKPVVAAAMAKKMELRTGFLAGLETRERVKEEDQGMWNMSNISDNSGGFLSGFGDLDGFIQELGEFPFLPNSDASHMHGFEEAQLA